MLSQSRTEKCSVVAQRVVAERRGGGNDDLNVGLIRGQFRDVASDC